MGYLNRKYLLSATEGVVLAPDLMGRIDGITTVRRGPSRRVSSGAAQGQRDRMTRAAGPRALPCDRTTAESGQLMRCPICSSPLREGATKCDECGCGILPPPPAGIEPTPFVRAAATPKWPLVLSIVGVVAALVVIAVALLPLADNGDDSNVQTATTPLESVPVTSAGPSSAPTSGGEPTSGPAAATSIAPAPTTSSPIIGSSTTPSGSSTSGSSTSESSTSSSSSTTPARPTTTVAPASTPTEVFPAPVNIVLVQSTCTAPDSTDSRGNRITFNPLLTVDGVPDTAWRCPGDSIHQALVFSLARPSTVTALAAIPGYAGADPYNGMDRFEQNRRVQRARWACLDGTGTEVASTEQLFTGDRRLQGITVTGFTGCTQIIFEILDSSPSGSRDYTAVSEIGIYGPTG